LFLRVFLDPQGLDVRSFAYLKGRDGIGFVYTTSNRTTGAVRVEVGAFKVGPFERVFALPKYLLIINSF